MPLPHYCIILETLLKRTGSPAPGSIELDNSLWRAKSSACESLRAQQLSKLPSDHFFSVFFAPAPLSWCSKNCQLPTLEFYFGLIRHFSSKLWKSITHIEKHNGMKASEFCSMHACWTETKGGHFSSLVCKYFAWLASSHASLGYISVCPVPGSRKQDQFYYGTTLCCRCVLQVANYVFQIYLYNTNVSRKLIFLNDTVDIRFSWLSSCSKVLVTAMAKFCATYIKFQFGFINNWSMIENTEQLMNSVSPDWEIALGEWSKLMFHYCVKKNKFQWFIMQNKIPFHINYILLQLWMEQFKTSLESQPWLSLSLLAPKN